MKEVIEGIWKDDQIQEQVMRDRDFYSYQKPSVSWTHKMFVANRENRWALARHLPRMVKCAISSVWYIGIFSKE